MFRWRPDVEAMVASRPARQRVLEALGSGGSVLDVGVGGGAGSIGLGPTATHITGVDPLPGMLELFESAARAAGVASRAVVGSWPDVAAEVGPVDVAVSYHALYGVTEIEDFLAALTARARRRVVVELTADPPMSTLDPLFERLHGIQRPTWRVADDVHAVLTSMGLAVEREDVVSPPRPQDVSPDSVAFARRRLHVGSDRDPEILDFLRSLPPRTATYAALWWPGTA